jgi:hypothetical protein
MRIPPHSSQHRLSPFRWPFGQPGRGDSRNLGTGTGDAATCESRAGWDVEVRRTGWMLGVTSLSASSAYRDLQLVASMATLLT